MQKLRLTRETLQRLTGEEARKVAGGRIAPTMEFTKCWDTNEGLPYTCNHCYTGPFGGCNPDW